ncbi:MAG TPA: trypsin-like peptidase domain-containing protein [Candidatus Saccharimonadaceae bacterium]|nr:trypsin-like peptidase domain-containing protein [Candidatus Saccharimonadaceae bacterium]
MNERDLSKPEGIPAMSDAKPDKTKSTSRSQKSVNSGETTAVYSPSGPPRLSHTRRLVIGGIVLIILCFLGGFGGARLASYGVTTDVVSSTSPQSDGNKIVTTQEKDITNVVSKVSPSVVSIVTTSSGGNSPFGVSSATESAGTGIILSKDGYIITNHHVVGDATSATVVLADGTTYKNVKVVGHDPLNDIAFLKISGVNSLTPAEIGDSSTVRVGQQVVAIGNSLGQYQNTVTSGIISGKGRPISAQDGNSVENLTDLIQTDAAINPGNSGGPLLNIAGQVIGIDTAVAQNAQGIGFAIPINSTKGEIAGVLAGKGVQRAYLGLQYIPVTPDVAQQYNLPIKQGAYVSSAGNGGSPIVSGSPADKAGIKSGDIITKVNDQVVGPAGSLSSLMGEYQPGDTVKLTLRRGGSTKTVSVTLAKYTGPDQTSSSDNSSQQQQDQQNQDQQSPNQFFFPF